MNESAVYEIKLKDSFSQGLGKLEGRMNGFETKVGGLKGSFSSLGSTISGAFAGGLVAGGIASLVSGLKDVATEAFNLTREFTNLKEAIQFASGTDAQTNIKFLDETIDKLGLDLQSTYKGFKTFQGALMGTSLEGEQGRKIFESVSKASSVMKLSADATEGAFLALGQMISKGTVSAEELRGQLGERLPGAFQIAARAMGVTTAELGDMMKKGEVAAEDFLPKFANELEKTFGPGVRKSQDSFNANWNRFNNSIMRAKIALGERFLPVLNDFLKIIRELDFSAFSYTFEQIGEEISFFSDALSDIFSLLGINMDKFSTFQLLVQAIGFSFRAGLTPLRITIELVTLLVHTVVSAIDVFKGLGKVIAGVFTLDQDQIMSGLGNIEKGAKTFKKTVIDQGIDFAKKEAEGWAKVFSLPGQKSKNGVTDAQGGTSGAGGLNMSKSSRGTAGSNAIGVEKIQAGTKSITLNISKVIEKVVFEKGYEKSEANLQDMISRTVIAALNDVNIQSQ